MVHRHTLARAVVLAVIACSGIGEAGAASRLDHQPYAARTASYWRHYGYPRPNCTYAIAEFQRRWSYQLWPPSMRCFPYPH